MEKALFSISCTTCRARLAVRNKEAIGAILECPKCHSMVQVTPPDDWTENDAKEAASAVKSQSLLPVQSPPPASRQIPPATVKRSPDAVEAPPVSVAATAKNGSSNNPPANKQPASVGPVETSPETNVPVQKLNGQAPVGTAVNSVMAKRVAKIVAAREVDTSTAESVDAAVVANLLALPTNGKQPPIPIQRPSEAPSLAFTAADVIEPSGLVARINAIVADSVWAQALVLGVSAMLGLALVVAGGLWYSHLKEPPPQEQATQQPKTSAAPSPILAPPLPRADAVRFDPAWVPDDTCLLINFAPSRLSNARLNGEPVFGKLLLAGSASWNSTVGALFTCLGLGPGQVQRITWASNDLQAPAEHCVVVVELNSDQDAFHFGQPEDAVDVGMPRATFHHYKGGIWPHPIMLPDAQTIVTGDLASLKALASQGSSHRTGSVLERLAKTSPTDADFTMLIELAAARKAGWSMPAAMNLWPAQRQLWHTLCDTPAAVGISLQCSGRLKNEIALLCGNDAEAEEVKSVADNFLLTISKAIPGQSADVAARIKSGALEHLAGESYELLLDHLNIAIRSLHSKVTDCIVRLEATWPVGGPLVTILAAIDGKPAWQAELRKAARTIDESRHRELLQSLTKYANEQKPSSFPSGLAGKDTLSPPDRQLSWLVTLLPYFGHEDWHKRIDFNRSWDDRKNQIVTRRELEQVANPALGRGASLDGYPVTNYVGVAGFGKDAAMEPAGSPRAGIFGYGRQARLEDLQRGAANTIAILGVSECGPWAQGGKSTVRALVNRPYVNGPDGFGSGQPDGMLAGMADDSVRFISKNCDPQVLEQLVAIHGNAPVDLAMLDPGDAAVPGAFPHDPIRHVPAPQIQPIAHTLPPLNQPRFTPAKPPAPPDASTASHLAMPLAKIRLPKLTLGQAVETLAEIGNLTVSYDLDALEEAGASLRDPVTELELTQASVEQSFDALLESHQLAIQAEGKLVTVTSPPKNRNLLTGVNYAVRDLTGGSPQAAADLAAIIVRMVAPESWQAGGGPGSIESSPDSLHINQTPAVRFQSLLFCEKLRIARHLSTKSERSQKNAEQFSLASRWQRFRPALDKPVSATFREPTPLAAILAELGKAADVDLLIDQASLAAAGQSNPRPKFIADKVPLAQVLSDLLKPLNLAWRAVDARTIQIASEKTLAARLELEFYPVAELLAKEQPDVLTERIKEAVGKAAWAENDGLGVMIVDAPSKCLIVLQTPAVQMELGMLLGEKKP